VSNTTLGKIIILSLTFVVVSIFVFSNFGVTEKVYDCRDAHWLPDVPVEVKKQCQELLKQELLKQKRITI
jgi:hypothetical protein